MQASPKQRSPVLKRPSILGTAAVLCLISIPVLGDPPPPAATPPPPAATSSPPAATPAPKQTVREACSQDIQTVCAGVQPGEGRIRLCMRQHFRELSAGCRDSIRENRREHPPGAPG